MQYTTDYVYDWHKKGLENGMANFSAFEAELSYTIKKNCSLLPSGTIICENSNKEFCDNAIYLGEFRNIWGHCITDNLKKLWFLETDYSKELVRNGYRLVCTLYGAKTFINNFNELLSLLDINPGDIDIIKEETSFSNLLIPDDSMNDVHQYHRFFKSTIDRIVDKVQITDNSPEKIYFSRTKLNQKYRDFGECYIEKVFQDLGYSIIYPEELSLKKQLALLKGCKSFAATDGSVAHNVMFCSDGVENIVIRKAVTWIPYQYSAMQLRNATAIYVDSHLSIFVVFAIWSGPFFMYISEPFVKFAKDRGLNINVSFSKKLFIQYSMVCLFYFLRYRLKPKTLDKAYMKYYKPLLKKLLFA